MDAKRNKYYFETVEKKFCWSFFFWFNVILFSGKKCFRANLYIIEIHISIVNQDVRSLNYNKYTRREKRKKGRNEKKRNESFNNKIHPLLLIYNRKTYFNINGSNGDYMVFLLEIGYMVVCWYRQNILVRIIL